MSDDENLQEHNDLQQWLKFADDWLGEEWLEAEVHHLREAAKLIEDRIANLDGMLKDIYFRRRRLNELDKRIRENSPT